MEERKMVMLLTAHPKENTERCSMGLSIASSALASDIDTEVFCAMDGLFLAVKDYVKDLSFGKFPPLQDLLDMYLECGGKLFVCQPFLEVRGVSEDDLIPEATLAAGPTLVHHGSDSTVLTI